MENYSYDDPDTPMKRPFGTVFKAIYVSLMQVIGIIIVVLAAVWLGNYCGGFAWSTPALIFNYHPLFMLVGMVFLFGNALAVHRVFHDMKRQVVKILHASLLVLSLVFAAAALAAVFTSNGEAGYSNMYSLHSWVGLCTLLLFLSQWIAGLVILLLRRGSYLLRVNYKPVHSFMGCLIFAMAIATSLLGTFEYVLFQAGADYSHLSSQGVLVNFMGLLLILFAVLIVFFVTSSRFKDDGTVVENDKEFRHLN